MEGLEAALRLVREPLAALGGDAWIVGGGVRDALLGRAVVDVDVAYHGDAAAAAAAVADHARAGLFPLSERFGGWRVHGKRLGITVDIIPLGGSLAEDLGRRDFTINALAVPVSGGEVVDLHGGRADLEARTLRLVSAEAFRDDPVRLMRLPRQARELEFSIDAAAADRCRADAAMVSLPAPERVFDELRRLLSLESPELGVALLDNLGLLTRLAPVVSPARAVAAARAAGALVDESMGREFADGLTRGALAVWAATLAADPAFGCDEARAWAERMRTSSKLRDGLARMVKGAATFDHQWTPDECVDFLLARAPVEAESVLVALAVGTASATSSAHASEVLAMLDTLKMRLAPGPFVAGDVLAAHLGLTPGPWLGQLIAALAREQATGRITSRRDAILFAETWQTK